MSLHDKSSSVVQTVSKIPNLKLIIINKTKSEKYVYFQTSKTFQICSECRILHSIFKKFQGVGMFPNPLENVACFPGLNGKVENWKGK
jgi:hypothetical protein